jgi:Bifunctional DNA primase/polymerase, N-terminal
MPASSSQRNPRASFDAAIRYAERGWHVFPVKRRGKRPVIEHGFLEATTDRATISTWWASHPDANVGIRTGNASSLVVVDVDGEVGMHSIKTLIAEHGCFPAVWVRTGSGGWHAYFAHPGIEVRNSTGKLGAGLDVRGDGGYVVAPPSVHPCGGTYQWHTGLPEQFAPLPGWVVDRLATPAAASASAPSTAFRDLAYGLTAYTRAAIEGETRAVASAPEGQRNDTLYRAAFKLGTLVGASLVSRSTVEQLLDIAARTAQIPEVEAGRTIRSGLDGGERNPREVAR